MCFESSLSANIYRRLMTKRNIFCLDLRTVFVSACLHTYICLCVVYLHVHVCIFAYPLNLFYLILCIGTFPYVSTSFLLCLSVPLSTSFWLCLSIPLSTSFWLCLSIPLPASLSLRIYIFALFKSVCLTLSKNIYNVCVSVYLGRCMSILMSTNLEVVYLTFERLWKLPRETFAPVWSLIKLFMLTNLVLEIKAKGSIQKYSKSVTP